MKMFWNKPWKMDIHDFSIIGLNEFLYRLFLLLQFVLLLSSLKTIPFYYNNIQILFILTLFISMAQLCAFVNTIHGFFAASIQIDENMCAVISPGRMDTSVLHLFFRCDHLGYAIITLVGGNVRFSMVISDGIRKIVNNGRVGGNVSIWWWVLTGYWDVLGFNWKWGNVCFGVKEWM